MSITPDEPLLGDMSTDDILLDELLDELLGDMVRYLRLRDGREPPDPYPMPGRAIPRHAVRGCATGVPGTGAPENRVTTASHREGRHTCP